MIIYAPSNDNLVYWYYGTGANVLTVSIAGTITTNIEKWIFTNGPAGTAIWRDGVKIASQATPRTRTLNASQWRRCACPAGSCSSTLRRPDS
jgi:hypothetical protein